MVVRVAALVELAVLLEREIRHQHRHHKGIMVALNTPAGLTVVLVAAAVRVLLASRLQTVTALMAVLAHLTRILDRRLHTRVAVVAGLMVVAREQLAAQAVRVVVVMAPQQEPQQQEL
jgi:hypothetical protein